MTARHFAFLVAGLALGFGVVLTCADQAGIRINTTPSVPLGLWRLLPINAPVAGDYVEICPPDNADFHLARQRGYIGDGRCASGYEPLFKLVAALPGDMVTVTKTGIAVNGRRIPNSQALAEDHRGLLLYGFPVGTSVVPPSHVWLISGRTPDSFDSRYFGPLTLDVIQGKIVPLLVLGGRDAGH